MAEIQLVLTDFDGTVAEFGKHIVSDNVRQTVIACEEAGIRMVPVTGRYYEMARPVLELLGFEDLGVFDNGASIQNCMTGELIWTQWMSAEQVRHAASICAPYARIIDYTPEHNEHELADNELEHIAAVDQPASHVFAIVPTVKIEEITEQLRGVPDITFYTAPSTYGEHDHLGIQINHIRADKFHGVEALRAIVGIAKDHTLAIGDGDNDVSLFENADIKIAMGNATESLKSKADHIVGTIENDGFVEAMERFVLQTTEKSL